MTSQPQALFFLYSGPSSHDIINLFCGRAQSRKNIRPGYHSMALSARDREGSVLDARPEGPQGLRPQAMLWLPADCQSCSYRPTYRSEGKAQAVGHDD